MILDAHKVANYNYICLQKLNGCFDLAVVILIAVLSDTQDDYQFTVGIGMLQVN